MFTGVGVFYKETADSINYLKKKETVTDFTVTASD